MNERSSTASRAPEVGLRMRGNRLLLLVISSLALLSLALAILGGSVPKSVPTTVNSRKTWMKLYTGLPLSFERNQGQTDQRVKFLSRGRGYTLFLTSDEAVLALRSQESEVRSQKSANRQSAGVSDPLQRATDNRPRTTDTLRMKLVAANQAAQVTALDELPGKSNYFLGNDPKQWRTDVPSYARVRYEGIYPGIDLIYYGNQRQLEYDFVVNPGADPRAIALELETGNSKLENRNSKIAIDRNGDLVIATVSGQVRFHKPLVYQSESLFVSQHSTIKRNGPAGTTDNGPRTTDELNRQSTIGNRQLLDGHYVLTADNQIRFEIPSYDKSRPLVIDPVLSYSTYLGGTGGDVGYGIAVDSSGDAYIAGITTSTNFPTLNGYQGSNGGSSDAFVTKLNADGTALVYSTYLGGSGADSAAAIAVDASGDAFITGSTSSSNFPTFSSSTTPFQAVYGGNTDAFVTELHGDGNTLVYSSYLGGSGLDSGQGIAVDTTGNAYVTGSTQSIDFPTVSPMQTTNAGSSDVFVAKVNFGGTALVYSTYLGGSQADVGQAIKVDSSGNAFLTGYTFSLDFPTLNPLQGTNAGPPDAFVAELNAAGSALTFSTFQGGTGDDRGFGIALDSTGIYITGSSSSTDFPTTSNTLQIANHGQSDAFVTKYNPAGSAFLYSTLLGGSGLDQGNGIAVDSSGDAYIMGTTRSGDFPTANPVQGVLGLTGGGSCASGVCADAFISELSPTGSGLLFSTYLGGSRDDFGQGIALASGGDALVTGSTSSTNFPATAPTYQGTLNGIAGNAFVAEISPASAPGLAIMPQKVDFGNQTVSVRSAAQAITVADVGTQPLSITEITSSSTDFVETDNCIGTVPAGGGTCTINVTFTPSAQGSETATLTVTDNASGNPHTINLSGTGAQTVTITNTGTSTLSITNIGATGDYSETNTCTTGLLNVGESCSVSIVFNPTATGGRNGNLSISDNAVGSPQVVPLSGTGLPNFSLSSTSPKTTVIIGSTTATIPVAASTASNFTGNITLACSSGATCTFSPATIFAGQSSTLTLSSLTASTPNPFNFTVSGTSGSQTATLSLTVLFSDYALSVTPQIQTITSGQVATYSVIVTPSNGFNQQVQLACPNLPIDATCSFSSSNVTPNGGVASVTLNISTVKNTASMLGRRLPPGGGPPPAWLLLAFMGVLWGMLRLRTYLNNRPAAVRRLPSLWSRAVSCGLALTLLAMLAGCRPASTTATSGTPTGNYIITITGTLTSNTTVVRNTTLDLAVT
ncbi:MAG: SBBP repeat-containing protein [Acidobacteriia bacterium]|nr:SBBP repeat-containing protein [Terriglobia bacterium]